MNISWLLLNTARKFPERTALVAEEGRLSYSQLLARARAVAGALRARGLRPGQRVGLVFYNCARMVESYFGVVMAGLVATPVNFRLRPGEMRYILSHSGARAVIFGREFVEVVGEALGERARGMLLVCPGGSRELGAQDYEKMVEGAGWRGEPEAVGESETCQLMYTSGTTGRPKGALITHGNVLWNLHNTIYGREDRCGEVSIVVGPLYHTAALNNHLTIQIALGGTSVLMKKFEPELMMRTIEATRATVISGAPAMYNLLMAEPRAWDYDRTSITKCTCGADKLAMETKRQLMRFFPNIEGVYDVYGCTEASPCITILSARDSLRKHGSVGQALPFLEARVVDEAGQVLGPGEVGEVVCRGPNVMKGYHDDPEATARAITNGWLHTGDLGRVDEEGFFYIVDRKKDMIVSGGENIYPREIEEVLYTHPEIVEAAVVGLPDPVWGEKVVAFVVKRPGSGLEAQGVVEFCREHLASYKKPREVIFLEALPRTASGKVLKRELKQRWGGRGEGTG